MIEPVLMPFQNQPFNGDSAIEKEFLFLKNNHNINTAIETGSCCYGTTKFLADNFEKVFTIELNPDNAKIGLKNILKYKNVLACLGYSEVVMENIISNHLKPTDTCIFFLDAHWCGNFPILKELELISNIKTLNPPVIAIHDFYTNDVNLSYDTYNNVVLNYNYIEPALKIISSKLNVNYVHYYNNSQTALGAKAGIIYLWPKLN